MGTTLRCTAKLLKALKAQASRGEVPAPDNRLGEWTANLVRVSRVQLVIAVNEGTRFAIAVDAAPYALIQERLGSRLFEALDWIGIPEAAAVEEALALRDAGLAATNSRSVLATLNSYADYAHRVIGSGVVTSAAKLTREFAPWIVLSPTLMYPGERVREAFGLDAKLPPHVDREHASGED